MAIFILVVVVLAIAFTYSISVAGTKPVKGSDFYTVSRDGRVLSSKGPRVTCLRPKAGPDGMLITLRNGSRTGEFFVHELVAEAHVPNPSGRKQVRHRDGNKNNNKAGNLEWF